MDPEVTIIGALPPIVGISHYTANLVECLSRQINVSFLGFKHIYPAALFPGQLTDPTTVTPSETSNLEINNCLNWFNPLGWMAQAFAIRSRLVHGQWWSYPLAPVYIVILGISKLRRKKNLLTVHNVLPHENTVYRRFVHTAVYHFADEFIVHTEENRNRLMTMVNNKKVHIVHHGVSQPRQVSMTRPEARQLLGIGRDDKILLCFGHIRAYKGLDVAIDALANTEDKSIKLLVVGKCWGEWDKYQQKINARRLEGRIIVKPGYVPTDQIEAYFRAVDLVLLPYTHFDAQSGVGAMAVGFQTPLIVSDAGGLKEYVGSRDFVFKSGDSEELAGKIGSALSNPFLERDCAAHMQALGEDLGWQSAADKTVAIYRSMLGQL